MHDTIPKSDSLISKLNTPKVVNILRGVECCDFQHGSSSTSTWIRKAKAEDWALLICIQPQKFYFRKIPRVSDAPARRTVQMQKAQTCRVNALSFFNFSKHRSSGELENSLGRHFNSQSEFRFSEKLICSVRKQFVKAFPGWLDSPLTLSRLCVAACG